VDPARAIQQYKISALLDWMKNFVMPRGHSSEDTQREAAND
jgi:hypothetical protein